MNFFRGLNKEQWTALVAVALSCLFLLFGFGGGSAPASELPKNAAEEPYVALRPRYVELPDEKFERYWTGKKIFNVESGQKLPLPILKAPEPREEEMPVPPFRPGPAWEIYNRLSGPLKYPMLTPGSPVVAEANLPTAAEVADLCKMEETAVAARPDLRDKKEREFALIPLKAPGSKPMEVSEITDDDPNLPFVFYKDKAGNRRRIDRAAVGGPILSNNTNERQYQIDTEKIRSGPKEVDERLKLAQWCLERGMLPEAKAEVKKAFEAKRDSLETILLLGQLATESSDFETAIATYRAGMDAGAPAGELWYEIGRCLRAISLHEGALAAFEKAVESQPRLHRARLALARAYVDAGNHAAAIEAATDFFTKMGNSPDTTAAHRAEAALVRGLAYVRAGQLDRARADFAETLKVDPANAEALNGMGAAFALEGQFPQAGPEFVKAIRANQYLTEAWTNLAALFLLGGKWAEAEQLSAAAAQRDPASVEALLGMGLAQLLAGKKDGPATIGRAEQMDPKHLQVLMVAGLFLLRQGQDEEALQKFVSALRQEYHFLPAYSGAAAAYLRTARKLALNRDDASAKKAGELRINAATLLQAMRNFDPNRPGVWTALGCAYAVMQRPEDARMMLRQAKESDPLVFYTRGYVEYYYADAEDAARLDLAHREFEQAVKLETTAVDPFSQRVIADCKVAVDQIEQWKRTSLRLIEEFNGLDAKNIGSGWIETEGMYGIQVTREVHKEKGGRGKFAGKQAIKDWGLTSLAHEIPGADFHSFEITLVPEKIADKSEFGVSIFTTKTGDHWSGLSVGFDAAGKAKISTNSQDRDMDGHDMSIGWTDIKIAPPNPKEITLKIAVAEVRRQKTFSVSFWNAQKGDWVVAVKDQGFNATSQGTWRVAAWTRAWKDLDVVLYVDNIRVLDQARR
jgi:tetratricopeptide (TPR) repeat protein